MQNQVETMRERWNNRAIAGLLWPLIVEQVLAVTIGMMDTVMVTSVGEFAVSGVSIVDAVNMVLIIAFSALATGGAVVVSQFIGRADVKKARVSAKQLIYTSGIVSVLIMGFALATRTVLLRGIYGNIADDVMQAAETYLLLSALSYPFLALYNAAASLFRSAGNSRAPMLIALLVNALNIGGNAFFIYGCHWGVLGAGLATLISRAVAAIVLVVVLLLDKKSPISLAGLFRVRLNGTIIRSMLRVGIPSGLESSMFQVGKVMVSRVFTAFGTSAIAANAIAGSISSFTFMPGNGFGIALLTIAGQCAGARDFDAEKYLTRKLMVLTYGAIGLFAVLIFFLRSNIIGFFGLSGEASALAKSLLLIHCISAPIVWPASFTLPNALRANGDAKFCMVVAVLSMWIIRVSFAYICAYTFKMGPAGAWISMSADWVVRAICYTFRWRSGRWRTKTVI